MRRVGRRFGRRFPRLLRRRHGGSGTAARLRAPTKTRVYNTLRNTMGLLHGPFRG